MTVSVNIGNFELKHPTVGVRSCLPFLDRSISLRLRAGKVAYGADTHSHTNSRLSLDID